MENTIVVLPTGAGKTLIGAAVIKETVTRNPNRPRALFLVPTCILVRQQASVLRDETALNVVEFMGGRAVPVRFDILVATPAAFLNVMDAAPQYSLVNYALVTFDEVHHTGKNHPYMQIAEAIRFLDDSPRVLGLSASLTFATDEKKIYQSVANLCKLLRVRGEYVISSTKEELRAGGYHAADVEPEVSTGKAYITLESDDEACAGLEIPTQTSEMLQTFLYYVDNRYEPIHPLSLALMAVLRDMEQKGREYDPEFIEPRVFKDKIGDWGDYVHERALSPTATDIQRAIYTVLEHLYEAVRIIVNSKQLALELAMRYLEMTNILGLDADFESEHLSTLQRLWDRCVVSIHRIRVLTCV